MTSFLRDRLTWLAYLMLAFFAYMLATLGPLMPFLRAELDLNYTVAAFHLSAFAIGMVIAGLTGDRVARRWGRRTIFWAGGAGLALGGVLLTVGRAAPVTISSVLLMGLVGSYIGIIVPAMLADRHGQRRAIALTESNVAASIGAACAPLLIGFGEMSGLGWRVSLIAGAILWLILVVVFRRTEIPSAPVVEADAPSRPLPCLFWAYWLVILLGVAIEWCVEFWGADFLQNSVGLEKVSAATLMSLFFAAMIIGRVAGSRLTHRMDAGRLLVAAVAIILVGFPLFWLARTPLLNIAGLFVSGLGIANLFPLTLSVATGLDPQQSGAASARVSLASGMAILIAPQVLASVADRAGIYNAFAVAAALLFAIAMIVVGAYRVSVRRTKVA